MSQPVRELWNPWTTAFMAAEKSSAHTLPLGHLPPTGASPFVLASVWERDANGGVQRVPLVPERTNN
jgi:hypothetical protein